MLHQRLIKATAARIEVSTVRVSGWDQVAHSPGYAFVPSAYADGTDSSVPPTRRQEIHNPRWIFYLLLDHPAIGFRNQFTATIAADHLTETTPGRHRIKPHLDRFEFLQRLFSQLHRRAFIAALVRRAGANQQRHRIRVRHIFAADFLREFLGGAQSSLALI